MHSVKSFLIAVVLLLLIAGCFITSLLIYFGPLIILFWVGGVLKINRRTLYYDMILSWDINANLMMGGDEQVRVSDRIWYWSNKGCCVAEYMREAVDMLMYPLDGAGHCKQSFMSNAVLTSGAQIPHPFPFFTGSVVRSCMGERV